VRLIPVYYVLMTTRRLRLLSTPCSSVVEISLVTFPFLFCVLEFNIILQSQSWVLRHTGPLALESAMKTGFRWNIPYFFAPHTVLLYSNSLSADIISQSRLCFLLDVLDDIIVLRMLSASSTTRISLEN
jgi:hypothetical protein